ncbi:MAG: PQQ-like beta-propeller repeat protein [Candidatus Poribacteria bacterium]|nr:PQQ-like beta-propeller repeat protein [Candidatus Poribacteria bacterium]
MERPQKPIRWWPLFIVITLAILGTIATWVSDAGHRQDKILLTSMIVIVTILLSVLWLLFFSELRWRAKLIVLAVVGLGVFLGANLYQFKGFSGDLVPVFERRWEEKQSTFRMFSGNVPNPQIAIANYPQFLGPNRNGVVTTIKLNLDWETYPPKLVWRQPVGAGWSGFAVVGNSAITQEQEGDWEKVVCYELHTGEIKWSHKDQARYNTPPAGLGPRATPTISGNKVYTVGSTGILNCLDFETGAQLWATNIFEENRAKAPPWGVSISPLVLGELVIVSAGGAVAYHRETGEIVWTGYRTQSGYSSPLLTTLAGVEQIVLFNQGLVTAHEPSSGELLWKQPWPIVECVAQPVPLPDDKLLVSTGYGVGAKLFQISRNPEDEFNVSPEKEFNVSIVWETISFKAKFTNIIHYNGYLYGLDDGIFACVNPTDGTRQWKRGRYGHGQTLLISDVLLVLTESGEIVLVEPDPENHIEHARFDALKGRTWNTPAIVGPYLLVRNDQEAACYQLPVISMNTDFNTK